MVVIGRFSRNAPQTIEGRVFIVDDSFSFPSPPLEHVSVGNLVRSKREKSTRNANTTRRRRHVSDDTEESSKASEQHIRPSRTYTVFFFFLKRMSAIEHFSDRDDYRRVTVYVANQKKRVDGFLDKSSD